MREAGDAGLISGLEKSPGGRKATHSSILAWQIPWAEEPGGLQSMGSHRVVHDWAHTHTHSTQKRYFWAMDRYIFSSLGIYTPVRSTLHAVYEGFLFPQRHCVCASSLSHAWLFVSLWTAPGSSIHGISQARILEWVAISSSRQSSWPGDWTHVSSVSCIAGGFFTHWAIGEAHSCIIKL